MSPILIASDHAGFALKEKIKKFLSQKKYKSFDLGTHSEERCDYPRFGYELARKISRGRYNRGILICKTGIGISIVANRLSGVRAALCYNAEAAKLSREHNDSNVLVLGSAFVNIGLAKKIIAAWLKAEFEGGRHRKRLNQIKTIEQKIRGAR